MDASHHAAIAPVRARVFDVQNLSHMLTSFLLPFFCFVFLTICKKKNAPIKLPIYTHKRGTNHWVLERSPGLEGLNIKAWRKNTSSVSGCALTQRRLWQLMCADRTEIAHHTNPIAFVHTSMFDVFVCVVFDAGSHTLLHVHGVVLCYYCCWP